MRRSGSVSPAAARRSSAGSSSARSACSRDCSASRNRSCSRQPGSAASMRVTNRPARSIASSRDAARVVAGQRGAAGRRQFGQQRRGEQEVVQLGRQPGDDLVGEEVERRGGRSPTSPARSTAPPPASPRSAFIASRSPTGQPSARRCRRRRRRRPAERRRPADSASAPSKRRSATPNSATSSLRAQPRQRQRRRGRGCRCAIVQRGVKRAISQVDELEDLRVHDAVQVVDDDDAVRAPRRRRAR